MVDSIEARCSSGDSKKTGICEDGNLTTNAGRSCPSNPLTWFSLLWRTFYIVQSAGSMLVWQITKYSAADTSREDWSFRIEQVSQPRPAEWRNRNQTDQWQKSKVAGALMLTMGSLGPGSDHRGEGTLVFGFQDEDGGSLLTKQAPN